MRLSIAHFALALSAQVLSQYKADAFPATSTTQLSSTTSNGRNVVAFVPRFTSAPPVALRTPCLYATIDSSPSIAGAAADDGRVPTKEEQEDIEEAIRNTLIPKEVEKEYLKRERFEQEVVSMLKADASKAEKESNNKLFQKLKLFRDGTYVADPVNLNDPIDFVGLADVKKCMFFKIKGEGVVKNLGIMKFYLDLKRAPPLNLECDMEPMSDANYEELIGNKAVQFDNMMRVDSPLKCFLENAPAFCKPIEGDGHKTMCDLDYLEKYQVRQGTPYRYGGKAIVQNGDIIEISGVKKDDHDNFNKKLNIFLSSFGVHVVLVRHAVMGHLAMYQKYMMSLTAGRSDEYETLWNNHKGPNVLMKALTPEATNFVNFKIQLLIGPGNSLVGRATSFTNESIMAVNVDTYKKYYKMDPDTMVNYIGSEGSEGWNSACQKAWKAAQEVVQFICRDIKDSNELKDTDLRDLSMLLWVGTFYHGFIGDFQLDNVMKGNLVFPVTGEEHFQSVGYGTLSTTIGVTTAQRTMDMSTLRKFFQTKVDQEAWEHYQETLAECAKMTGINGFTYDDYVYNAIDF